MRRENEDDIEASDTVAADPSQVKLSQKKPVSIDLCDYGAPGHFSENVITEFETFEATGLATSDPTDIDESGKRSSRDGPGLTAELDALVRRGFSPKLAQIVSKESWREARASGRYLLDKKLISEEAYYSIVAEVLNVPFLPVGSFSLLAPKGTQELVIGQGKALNDCPGTGENAPAPCISSIGSVVVIAPAPETIPEITALFERFPELRARVRVASPAGLAMAKDEEEPARRLANRRPGACASERVTRAQKWSLFFLLVGVLVGLFATLKGVLLFSVVVVAVGSLGLSLLRLAAALEAAPCPRPSRMLRDYELPSYTVMIAVYKEAEIAPQLVASMEALDYPREKLQLLFLVEEEDKETQEALREHMPSWMHLFVVPEGGPKTKPRALCHGLKVASGELVTVFDAEDRPESDQLRKAASRFAELPEKVACLQARLAVDHVNDQFIVRQFAIEYAALFNSLLPWLSAQNVILPLGGTSNHFRRVVLEQIMAWDAYNVTEDADLGVRLARCGFVISMIDSTTWEEAPTTWKVWHGQRARWLKGWMQTMLVAMRDPVQTGRDLGVRSFAVLQLYFAGIFITLFAHPVFMLLAVSYGFGLIPPPLDATLVGDCVFVTACITGGVGLASSVISSSVATKKQGIAIDFWDLLFVPAYWFMQSLAFFTAIYDLVWRPFHWRKTAHGAAKRPKMANTHETGSVFAPWRHGRTGVAE